MPSVSTGQDRQAPSDWRAAGDRIATLLDASSTGGTVARERAEELVRLVADLYGAGLERVLNLMHERGHLDDETVAALAADDLVAGLLLVHGLHPYGVEQRVEQALEGVRPYLGSHGGDVELLEITGDGVVRLRLLGSCNGCPSSSVTLTLAVETAIEEAAPEVTSIEVRAPDTGATALIPAESLFSRVARAPAAEAGPVWHDASELLGLASGSVVPLGLDDTAIIGCRAGADLFAFLDRCAACDNPLGGSTVARRLGGSASSAVLTCPSCRAHFDLRRAGACVEDPEVHLDPLPLLADAVSVSIALPAPVPA